DANTWKTADWSEFNERYEYWRGKTAYPDLIDDLYFIDPKSNVAALHYEPAQKAFVPVEMTSIVSDLRGRLSDGNFRPVQEDIYTLVMPIREGGRKIEQI